MGAAVRIPEQERSGHRRCCELERSLSSWSSVKTFKSGLNAQALPMCDSVSLRHGEGDLILEYSSLTAELGSR